MSIDTGIQWTDHTGGPYFGCDKVSCGCANCYAWLLATTRLEHIFRGAYQKAGFEDWETRPVWGRNATRVLSKGFWKDAPRVNAMHAQAGTRGRWFPSMIDWLDEMPGGIIDLQGNKLDPARVLADFLKLVFETPNLDWLLLTKRPENWRSRIEKCLILANGGDPEDKDYFATHDCDFPANDFAFWLNEWTGGDAPDNVWIGVSTENQEQADKRIPELLKIPAKVRFLSVEPMLQVIDFANFIRWDHSKDDYGIKDSMAECDIDWVIFGGESGPNARPCDVCGLRYGVNQFQAAGVKVFVKQLGAKPIEPFYGSLDSGGVRERAIHLKDKKGGDMAEWPEDLRIREFPFSTGANGGNGE